MRCSIADSTMPGKTTPSRGRSAATASKAECGWAMETPSLPGRIAFEVVYQPPVLRLEFSHGITQGGVRDTGRHMQYNSPEVVDYGSIAAHTFYVGSQGNIKGGGDPQHVDSHCEWSGGSDANYEGCEVVTARP